MARPLWGTNACYKIEMVNSVVNEERLKMSRKSATRLDAQLDESDKRLVDVCMGFSELSALSAVC